MRFSVYLRAEGWAAVILADGGLPPEPGSVRAMAFFGERTEDVRRRALAHFGESVSRNRKSQTV